MMKRIMIVELGTENEELNSKLTKLTDFIENDDSGFMALSATSQKMLIAQSTAMATYSNILVARIGLYIKESEL